MSLLFPALVAASVLVLLLFKVIGKWRARSLPTHIKEKPFSATTQAVASTLAPIVIGAILVTVVFAYTENPKKFRKRILKRPKVVKVIALQSKELRSKIVFFDDHRFVPIDALSVCSDDDITVVSLGKVKCVDPNSEEGDHLLSLEIIDIKDATNFGVVVREDLTAFPLNVETPVLEVQRQLFFQVPSTNTLQEKKDKPFKDRYAEFFYFLALVAGVFGKYFQDYSEARKEAKKKGLKVEFDYTQIILSFIIGALVYYSIQEGIEKEAGKFTIRGVMFAFYNGYCWQTLLARKQVSVSTPKKTEVEK